MSCFCYESPVGSLTIAEEGGEITHILFGNIPCGEEAETPVIREAWRQLGEYFSKKRQKFDLPLKPKGTAFQQAVWQALYEIPYGESRSYSEIARIIGNEKSCRAVGLANGKNPISIVVPCHRVIGSNGRLIGYGGGLPIKEFLLGLEGTIQRGKP